MRRRPASSTVGTSSPRSLIATAPISTRSARPTPAGSWCGPACTSATPRCWPPSGPGGMRCWSTTSRRRRSRPTACSVSWSAATATWSLPATSTPPSAPTAVRTPRTSSASWRSSTSPRPTTSRSWGRSAIRAGPISSCAGTHRSSRRRSRPSCSSRTATASGGRAWRCSCAGRVTAPVPSPAPSPATAFRWRRPPAWCATSRSCEPCSTCCVGSTATSPRSTGCWCRPSRGWSRPTSGGCGGRRARRRSPSSPRSVRWSRGATS